MATLVLGAVGSALGAGFGGTEATTGAASGMRLSTSTRVLPPCT